MQDVWPLYARTNRVAEITAVENRGHEQRLRDRQLPRTVRRVSKRSDVSDCRLSPVSIHAFCISYMKNYSGKSQIDRRRGISAVAFRTDSALGTRYRSMIFASGTFPSAHVRASVLLLLYDAVLCPCSMSLRCRDGSPCHGSASVLHLTISRSVSSGMDWLFFRSLVRVTPCHVQIHRQRCPATPLLSTKAQRVTAGPSPRPAGIRVSPRRPPAPASPARSAPAKARSPCGAVPP